MQFLSNNWFANIQFIFIQKYIISKKKKKEEMRETNNIKNNND